MMYGTRAKRCESQKGMMRDVMDKWWRGINRQEKQTKQWKLETRATVRDGGSGDYMRRKRRLESFQPVFPALVVRVWCHHCLIQLFIHSSDQGEGDNGIATELTTFLFRLSITNSQLNCLLLCLFFLSALKSCPAALSLPHFTGFKSHQHGMFICFSLAGYPVSLLPPHP